jgi:hypothetical protein
MGIRWEREGESRPAPAMSVTASEYQPGSVSLVGHAPNSWLTPITFKFVAIAPALAMTQFSDAGSLSRAELRPSSIS